MSWALESQPLRQRYAANADVTTALELTRLALRHNVAHDARLWATRAAALDATAVPTRLLVQAQVPLVALPNEEAGTTLYALGEEDTLLSLQTLPVPAACHTTLDDEGVVVSLLLAEEQPQYGQRHRAVLVSELGGESHRLELPEGSEISAWVRDSARLFVAITEHGPNARVARLGWCDFESPHTTWRWLDLEKPFDALFIEGRQLVAVDNFVLPKFIFVYDLEQTPPALLSREPLTTHTTYEHIRFGVRNTHLMALLSGGINHGMARQFVALYPFDSLTENFCMWRDLSRGASHDDTEWCDLALVQNTLFVASGTAGVLALDLEAEPIAEALSHPSSSAEMLRYEQQHEDSRLRRQGHLRSCSLDLAPLTGWRARLFRHKPRVVRLVTPSHGNAVFALFTVPNASNLGWSRVLG